MTDDFDAIAADLGAALAHERWPSTPVHQWEVTTDAASEMFAVYDVPRSWPEATHAEFRAMLRRYERGRPTCEVEMLVTREALTAGPVAVRVIVEALRDHARRARDGRP